LIPFFTENKTPATLPTHAGRHRNNEQWLTVLYGAKQWLTVLYGAKQTAPLMLPAVIETVALVN